ncbi:MAG: choice-of-anchor D domain-containing protein, partial [bacterium]
MNSLRTLFFSSLISLITTVHVYPLTLEVLQPIEVSLPDSAVGEQGTSVTIPIIVGDLTGRNVLSYSAVITFDKNVLEVTGATSVATLSEPFGPPTVNIQDSLIIVGGFGPSPLTGSGTLVVLNFKVVGQPGEVTDLAFGGFLFNTGIPPATTIDGKFTVTSPSAADIVINPTAHDFGAVILDSSASQTFVLTNAGAADLVVSATDLTGTDAAHFKIESGGAPFTLAAGDSQNLVVSFTPTSEGAKSAALQILSNDPDEGALDVSLTGNGIPAPQPD